MTILPFSLPKDGAQLVKDAETLKRMEVDPQKEYNRLMGIYSDYMNAFPQLCTVLQLKKLEGSENDNRTISTILNEDFELPSTFQIPKYYNYYSYNSSGLPKSIVKDGSAAFQQSKLTDFQEGFTAAQLAARDSNVALLDKLVDNINASLKNNDIDAMAFALDLISRILLYPSTKTADKVNAILASPDPGI